MSEACTRPRVKVCCIQSLEEARLAVHCGASALGLVAQMPSGPGVIPEPRIAEIARWAPPAVACFLLTSLRDAPAIERQVRRTGVSTVQICDRPEPGAHQALRAALPALKLVQVVHVTGPASVDEAIELGRHADAVLLDSGNPDLSVKQLGGTGRRHDWALSTAIRERVEAPLFLAGGLTPQNVAEAVRRVGPYGLDVCSGVRSDGQLDAAKLEAFFAALAIA